MKPAAQSLNFIMSSLKVTKFSLKRGVTSSLRETFLQGNSEPTLKSRELRYYRAYRAGCIIVLFNKYSVCASEFALRLASIIIS